MKKLAMLLISIQALAQEPSLSERAKEFERVTEIKLGRYRVDKGDESVCRGGGLRVLELENRFTLALGQMGLVYSLGIDELAFEEGKCKTVDKSTYTKGEVKQHSETNCEGEPTKYFDVVLQKTKKGFKYTRTMTQNNTVIAQENCELKLR